MTSLDKKKSTEKEIVLEINQHKIDECYSLLVFPKKITRPSGDFAFDI